MLCHFCFRHYTYNQYRHSRTFLKGPNWDFTKRKLKWTPLVVELVVPIGRHSLTFCWESSIMQGNGAHWRKVAATIWRHPQFLPNLFDICSAVRIFWIPANVIRVSIVFKYRSCDVFIPCDGSRCTVNECRRDAAARWGGFTAGRSSQNSHSLFIPL